MAMKECQDFKILKERLFDKESGKGKYNISSNYHRGDVVKVTFVKTQPVKLNPETQQLDNTNKEEGTVLLMINKANPYLDEYLKPFLKDMYLEDNTYDNENMDDVVLTEQEKLTFSSVEKRAEALQTKKQNIRNFYKSYNKRLNRGLLRDYNPGDEYKAVKGPNQYKTVNLLPDHLYVVFSNESDKIFLAWEKQQTLINPTHNGFATQKVLKYNGQDKKVYEGFMQQMVKPKRRKHDLNNNYNLVQTIVGKFLSCPTKYGGKIQEAKLQYNKEKKKKAKGPLAALLELVIPEPDPELCNESGKQQKLCVQDAQNKCEEALTSLQKLTKDEIYNMAASSGVNMSDCKTENTEAGSDAAKAQGTGSGASIMGFHFANKVSMGCAHALFSVAGTSQIFDSSTCMTNNTHICSAAKTTVKNMATIGGLDSCDKAFDIHITGDGNEVQIQQAVKQTFDGTTSVMINQDLSNTMVEKIKAQGKAVADNLLKKKGEGSKLGIVPDDGVDYGKMADSETSAISISDARSQFCKISTMNTNNIVGLKNVMHNSIENALAMCGSLTIDGNKNKLLISQTIDSHVSFAVSNGVTTVMSSFDKSDIETLLDAMASNKDITDLSGGLGWLGAVIGAVVGVVILVIIIVLIWKRKAIKKALGFDKVWPKIKTDFGDVNPLKILNKKV